MSLVVSREDVLGDPVTENLALCNALCSLLFRDLRPNVPVKSKQKKSNAIHRDLVLQSRHSPLPSLRWAHVDGFAKLLLVPLSEVIKGVIVVIVHWPETRLTVLAVKHC